MVEGPEDLRSFIEVPEVSAREETDVSAETLHRILDSAGDLYARFGVLKVTVADVAREAGVSKATMYRYVSGKRSLIGLYASRELGKVLMVQLAKASPRPDADTLVEIAATILAEIRDHPVYAKVAHDESQLIADTIIDPSIRSHVVAVVDLVAPIAEAAGIEDPRTSIEAVLRIGLTLLVLPPVVAGDGNYFEAVVDFIRPLVRPKELS